LKFKPQQEQQENILSEIFQSLPFLGKNNGVLFILLDEFGKFLEYAA
jgi:hypothetical protein